MVSNSCACSVPKLHSIHCDPIASSPPGCSVHGICQMRTISRVAIFSSRDVPDPGNKPVSTAAPALAVDSLPLSHVGRLSNTCYYCSVTKSCLTLCDRMDCSTPDFYILHYLPEFAHVHVHWVGDAILATKYFMIIVSLIFGVCIFYGFSYLYFLQSVWLQGLRSYVKQFREF